MCINLEFQPARSTQREEEFFLNVFLFLEDPLLFPADIIMTRKVFHVLEAISVV